MQGWLELQAEACSVALPAAPFSHLPKLSTLCCTCAPLAAQEKLRQEREKREAERREQEAREAEER